MIYGIVAGAKRPDGAYVIGKDNVMPWYLPDDLKLFKQKTLGKIIIMGRKTFENLPQKPLPGRTTVVLTTQNNWEFPGVDVAHDVESIIEKYATSEQDHIYVAGGSEIYRQFLPFMQQLFFTTIYRNIQGDTVFPFTHSELLHHFIPVFSDHHISTVRPEKWDGDPQVHWDHVIYQCKNQKGNDNYVYFPQTQNTAGEIDEFVMPLL